jgi:hypothetical protein
VTDIRLRREEVKNTTDVNKLVEIFKTDSNWAIRLQALVNIKDENILVNIASDLSLDWTFRKEALDRIGDQETLFHLASKEPLQELREFLVEKIKVRKYLLELKKVYLSKLGNQEHGILSGKITNQLSNLDNSISFILED